MHPSCTPGMERSLLGYEPRYTNVETIKITVQSYIDRGLLKA